MKETLRRAKDRFDRLDCGGRRSTGARLITAPAVWTALVVVSAAATWDASLALRPDVSAALAWSAGQVLDGEVWRLVSATALTREPIMLILLVIVTAPILWVLERLTSTTVALSVWAGGAVWGFAGATLLLRLGDVAGWDLATTTLATVDVGPSGGTAAAAAVVVALMDHRVITVVVVVALLVGSALHHQVADVEHLISFTTALVITSVLRGRLSR